MLLGPKLLGRVSIKNLYKTVFNYGQDDLMYSIGIVFLNFVVRYGLNIFILL